jgi:hypothetical protein
MDSDSFVETPVTSEERALRRAKTVSKLLDESVRVPGTDFRVGLDPVLGVLPGGGDLAASAISLYVVGEAARAGVPPSVLARMLFNVGLDAAGGSVPVAGTAFDTVWKANKRNVELFEAYVEAQREPVTHVPIE